MTSRIRFARRFLPAILLAFVVGGNSACADDWMYRASAYSHSPRWGQEVGVNRFARGPYYSPQYGAFVRSGYRNLNGNLGNGNSWSWDHTNIFESWVQYGEQYQY